MKKNPLWDIQITLTKVRLQQLQATCVWDVLMSTFNDHILLNT